MATIRQAGLMFVVLTILTGVIYPLAITGIAQAVFPHQANGSLMYTGTQGEGAEGSASRYAWFEAGQAKADGEGKAPICIGSTLIGQPFVGQQYFWGRPSATGPAYNGAASTGSNLGPTNPAQLDAVRQRVEAIRDTSGDAKAPVPIDLVTASASGLDPDISPAAADYQIPRVARARGMSEYLVRKLVAEHTEGRTLGLFGEPRVNVLLLNLALDHAHE